MVAPTLLAGNGQEWPAGEALLACTHRVTAGSAPPNGHTFRYLLAIPDTVLAGGALTDFLGRVAPFGCPVPGSLIRAYSLPDSPYPSILLKEHEVAPNGLSEAYLRFLARSRRQWLAALQETGPGLCPALAWETRVAASSDASRVSGSASAARRFLDADERQAMLSDAGIVLNGVADDYLGRALLLLAHPGTARSWQTVMSLGGPTKERNMTGREFPVWVDLPAHQPDLLASPLLAGVEGLLAQPNP